MTIDQAWLFVLLGLVLALLLWGRIRYDVVAFGALLAAFAIGAVPADRLFSGFGHPATVVVALVLVISSGLVNSGVIEVLARHLVIASRSLPAHIGIMATISAALSAVMNNVAALAMLMPLDLQAAAKAKRSPALSLMPLSFATILGGMVTLIGTPPNIVIAAYRQDALGAPYGMFDFTPVGIVVATVGVVYVALAGWRLIPASRGERDAARELRSLDEYVIEATPAEESPAIGKLVRELAALAEDSDVMVLGLVRRGHRLPGTARSQTVHKSDALVLEGAPGAVDQFAASAGLRLGSTKERPGLLAEHLTLVEVVVPEGAFAESRSAADLRLLQRHAVSLLGVSRSGERFRDRVRRLPLRAGDLLLLLGPEDRMDDVVTWLGCLPLADRATHVMQRQKAWAAVALFAAAIVAASLGWLELPVALAAVATAYVVLRIVPLSQLYTSVQWPVIVLLGSLIPVGAALETSGGTTLIARAIAAGAADLHPAAVLVLLMVVTMTLSDVLNNVATALIAAPIAVDVATHLGVSPDPFLMGVAVAASCAFLTPIGHKNNTIVMGPGGYRFGDYWRMGLPLEVLVLAVGTPAILWVWPL